MIYNIIKSHFRHIYISIWNRVNWWIVRGLGCINPTFIGIRKVNLGIIMRSGAVSSNIWVSCNNIFKIYKKPVTLIGRKITYIRQGCIRVRVWRSISRWVLLIRYRIFRNHVIGFFNRGIFQIVRINWFIRSRRNIYKIIRFIYINISLTWSTRN